jgi:hypothetical protein
MILERMLAIEIVTPETQVIMSMPMFLLIAKG